MRDLIQRFIGDERGATAIEYALIAAIAATGIVVALQQIRGNLNAAFNRVSTNLGAAN
ncbi:Flp family type IVb pilin [Alsobacter sp. KACC 23698]|uniref:Flp family type IVb pilin n=1 Tax=Alsobacter sp. KACC 23698 TaxID=3149229 RepID=A0AAU7JLB3_9HYPH